MIRQLADLKWSRDRVPVSTRFDDPYYSLESGLAETTHVFLDGNDLPARFAPGFAIGELGFGTGLNLLAAWALWEQSGQTTPLTYTSFEAWPLQRADMAQALMAFPELSTWRERLLEHWQMGGRITLETLHLKVVIGDARQTLPQWPGRADAWFLDGFSPAKNPELWGDELMAQVARHTGAQGTVATYTAAGHVRRALGAAGFDVERRAGYGRKRHMTTARLR